MQKKYYKEKGFAAAVTLLLAATLALIAYLVIDFGAIAINVANEKQTLDACSIAAGQSIINTNNISEVCKTSYLNECADYVNMKQPDFVCTDLGLECNIDNECKRKFSISSTYDPGRGNVTKSVIISVAEESHDVDLVDAAVIMLLDYSGSMSGNRIQQLKNTVTQFINEDYNLSYSAIIYNNSIIEKSSIGKGPQHKQTVLSMVNNTNPDGGTNFVTPLNEAMQQIQSTNYEAYYILLISDGSPNEGSGPSTNFVTNNVLNINDNNCIYTTRQNPCITIYTLGVDNANTSSLHAISGNTLDNNPNNFSFIVNASQVAAAFNAVIEEIMCRIGPVNTSGDFNVFNNITVLEENVDYVYDDTYKIIKFYDEEPFNICTNMLDNNAQITIRWGKPEIYVEH
jgi:uncharacterized protein YegL